MSKKPVKIMTSSCVKSLNAVNGMYPTTSCNHRMRSSNHQINTLIAKEAAARKEKHLLERKAYKERKERRKQLELLEVFSETFACLLVKSISYFPTNSTGIRFGGVTIGEVLASQGQSHCLQALVKK